MQAAPCSGRMALQGNSQARKPTLPATDLTNDILAYDDDESVWHRHFIKHQSKSKRMIELFITSSRPS